MIKSAPALSGAAASSGLSQELMEIQEEIRILEARASGSTDYRLTDKDRRTLEILQRRERTLIRKLRLENEAKQRSWLLRLKGSLRPFTILFGLIFLFMAIGVWVSMLLTAYVPHIASTFTTLSILKLSIGLIRSSTLPVESAVDISCPIQGSLIQSMPSSFRHPSSSRWIMRSS